MIQKNSPYLDHRLALYYNGGCARIFFPGTFVGCTDGQVDVTEPTLNVLIVGEPVEKSYTLMMHTIKERGIPWSGT